MLTGCTNRIVIVVNVRIICMQLKKLDFYNPVFLTLSHKSCVFVSIWLLCSWLSARNATLCIGVLQQRQRRMHWRGTDWIAGKRWRRKTLLALHHLLVIQLLLQRERRTMHSTHTDSTVHSQLHHKIVWLLVTRGQSNLTKSASRGAHPRLGVTPGGRKLYHWIPGVGFPISVP